jgi:exodeoxyribonuclease V alpha subunit
MKQAVDVHKVFAEYFKGVKALAYAVSKTLEEGSICLDLEVFKDSVENNSDAWQANPFNETAGNVAEMTADGIFVTHKEDELKPFVVMNNKVYLHRYFQYETQIIENIKRLGDNFRIITGGPGTGKTYSVGENLVKILKGDINKTIALAAPTGKAAARMNEALKNYALEKQKEPDDEVFTKLTSLKAQTLHRLLGYVRNSVFFKHNEENPLPFDVVVIDEASMIDGAMMAKLLNAIGDNTTFYLIGDKDQLASVEAGSVFGDICRAKDSALLKDKVEVKVENHRAKDSPELIDFSMKIIAGDEGYINSYSNNKEVVIDTEYDEDLFNEQIKLYKEYIEAPTVEEALKKLIRVRVLCVTREHDHSVAEANDRIEKYLKKTINDKDLFDPKDGFYHNQPVIITKNDYNLGLNNGDVGLIRKDGNGSFKFYYEGQDGELKSHPAGYLNNYETVFAMTIHKSQGSEFENVVVLLPEKQARKLLTRELLYTAVTRAKKKVLVQSTPESLEHCLENVVSRASGLTERIKETEK